RTQSKERFGDTIRMYNTRKRKEKTELLTIWQNAKMGTDAQPYRGGGPVQYKTMDRLR
ncbi:hypothetical protein SK128_026974, partial [Halocaridina rubra]